MNPSPTIFNFNTYRDYLDHFIAAQPKKGHGFLSKIAVELKVQSSFISQVIGGSKELSLEQAIRFSRFAGLNSIESDYWLDLVNFERAGSEELREYYRSRLENAKIKAKQIKNWMKYDLELTAEDQAVFYSDWLYSAIKNLVTLESHRKKELIAQYFNLTEKACDRYLDFLVTRKLITKTGTVYTPGPTRTFVDQSSPHLRSHHINWRLKAMENYSVQTDNDLAFTASLSISKKQFLQLRTKILKIIQETSESIRHTQPEVLGSFCIDLFTLKSKKVISKNKD